jgi:thiol-disulfide isomerase/thioredoxin
MTEWPARAARGVSSSRGLTREFLAGAGEAPACILCASQHHYLPLFKKMLSVPFGVKSALRIFPVVMLTLASAASLGAAGTAPKSIAVLDSLTGDSTIVRGKVVYVDFWASWCVPCRLSFPWMKDLQAKYGERGLQVVAINVDRDRAAARKFLEDVHASLPIVYDPAGKLAKLYDLQVMPTSFIYGRDGILRRRRDGFDPGEKQSVESLHGKILGEQPNK